MDLTDIKRWQWCIVGALLGAGLGYAWSNVEPAKQPRSVAPEVFESRIRANTEIKPGYPLMRNVVVMPPVNDIYPVYFEFATAGKDGWFYEKQWTATEIPFKPSRGSGAGLGDRETILTYLKASKQQDAKVSYSYAWWAEPKWTMVLAGLGGVVVVGGVWPTIIGLLVGAGLGPPPKPKEEYDLSRFGKGKKAKVEPSSMAAAARVGPTEEDLDKLDAMEAELARNVSGMQMGGAVGTGGGAGGASGPTTIKALESKPLEAVVDDKPNEPKEYKGDYYPTAVAAAHKPPAKPL